MSYQNLTNELKQVASRVLGNYPALNVIEAQEDFKVWNVAPKKHLFATWFKAEEFGAVYVVRVYKTRVRMFTEVLKRVTKDRSIQQFLSTVCSVTSLGCGPAPEMVAFVRFLGKGRYLQIINVDEQQYWAAYSHKLQQLLRGYCTVKFLNSHYSDDFLIKLQPTDVCLMSFNDAVAAEIDWCDLRDKFRLVIILDIINRKLAKTLKKLNFKYEFWNRIAVYYHFNRQEE